MLMNEGRMSHRDQDKPASPTDCTTASRSKTPRLKLSDLLQGSREAIIQHEDSEYRLRITTSGKLILTK
jgi:hemin uptake protein HemP